MPEATVRACIVCGEPAAGQTSRYCGNACKTRAYRGGMATPRVAQVKWGLALPVPVTECVECGEPVAPRSEFCSHDCVSRRYYRIRKVRERAARTAGLPPLPTSAFELAGGAIEWRDHQLVRDPGPPE